MKFSLLAVLLLPVSVWAAADLPDAIAALNAVGREGTGNEAATAGWKKVVQAGPSAIPALLAAAGKGNAVADNWIRLASDAIVSEARQKNAPLPIAEIEAFLRESRNPAAGRQLAFDLLAQAAPEHAKQIEPTLINDPVQDLRRGAVQRLIDAAKTASEPAQKKALFSQALDAVRDEDQTNVVARELKTLGVEVDLPRHFGFLTKWHIIGPFPNQDRTGFDTVFPPEKEIKLDATYDGKSKPVQWQAFEIKDERGKLDFNKPLGMEKEATAYATTTFEAETDREAELRLGGKNAWKVWLNGELLFGRDEYHRGQQMDQYTMKARLKKGPNVILVKCCQNEQKEEWTVEWEFQLRVCDSAGTAILAANSNAK